MKSTAKALMKLLLPMPVYEYFKERRKRQAEQHYLAQGFRKVKCGGYEIETPGSHILMKLHNSQPYRDLCVGIAAKYISAKYPYGTMIDVGANVGDTAAIMATYAKNELMLIEADDYFFKILARNSSKLNNKIVLKQAFILNGSEVRGDFRHQGGTAFFDPSTEGKIKVKTERLCDIAGRDTCFIKTDTEGFDHAILMDSLEWLASVRPAILLENRIRDVKELDSSNDLFARLMQIGYAYFIVWDDPGFHLLSTTSYGALSDLNRYLFKTWQSGGHKSIWNYDVLCLHKNDEDVYNSVHEWYQTY